MPGYGLAHRQRQSQRQTLTLSQKKVLGLVLLGMSQAEVETAGETLEEQGILESTMAVEDSSSSTEASKDVEDELASDSARLDGLADSDPDHEISQFLPEDISSSQRTPTGDDPSPEDYVTAPVAFRERILAQLGLVCLSEEQLRIARYIIDGLDGQGFFTEGFFTEGLIESAEACGVALEDFRAVLAEVQACEPVGVAARGPWDAVRLVLEKENRPGTAECRLAGLMVELAASGQLSQQVGGWSPSSPTDRIRAFFALCELLAARLALQVEEVKTTLIDISKLIPHPVDEHQQDATPWQDHHLQPVEERPPDLVISRTPDAQFKVELCAGRHSSFALSKVFIVDLEEIKHSLKSLAGTTQQASAAEEMEIKTKRVRLAILKEQKEECKRHALQFLAACEDRRATLLRVATVIIEKQTEFLKSGRLADLRCLSPSEVGEDLGRVEFGGQSLSESTVDRAVQGKLVRLPNGKVLPLKTLCAPGETATNTDGEEVQYLPELVKEWIRDYIRREDPNAPLTDEQMCQKIQDEEDLVLCRKTIENYRKHDDLLIPSARERMRKVIGR